MINSNLGHSNNRMILNAITQNKNKNITKQPDVTSMTSEERKKSNKMEENFISQAKSENEKISSDEVNLNELKTKVDKINEGDPYAGLTEEDAQKLKEMRDKYTNDIRQEKQEAYDRDFDKANNEHNKEVAKIKAKCEQIARVIASGKNYSKGDARYLGKNNPTSLSAALLQRSTNEMFRKKDEDKPKKITGKEDKNYDDLEFPELQFANGDLTESEKKGLPTAQDLPNFETQQIATSSIKAISIDIRM